jgi:AraC family transcriptional regulator
MGGQACTLNPDGYQRVLVRVHADMAGDLGLESLAAEARQSRAHFQRCFKATVGETPSGYVARVRIERAAYLMRVTEDTALSIALAVGYRNPDTFTRAFRRRFGCSPREFRKRGTFASRLGAARPIRGRPGRKYSLSPTRIVRGRRLSVAFLRHVGPYESVESALWSRLAEWASRRGITRGVLVGIGHDAPGVTAPENLRFDAGLVVDDDVRPCGGVGIQRLEAGDFALTTHLDRMSRWRPPTSRSSGGFGGLTAAA